MSQTGSEALAELDATVFPAAPVILTGLGLTAAGLARDRCRADRPPRRASSSSSSACSLVGVGLAAHLSAPRDRTRARLLTCRLVAARGRCGVRGEPRPGEVRPTRWPALLHSCALAAVIAAVLSALPPVVSPGSALSLLLVWHFFAIFTATPIIAAAGRATRPGWPRRSGRASPGRISSSRT